MTTRLLGAIKIKGGEAGEERYFIGEQAYHVDDGLVGFERVRNAGALRVKNMQIQLMPVPHLIFNSEVGLLAARAHRVCS